MLEITEEKISLKIFGEEVVLDKARRPQTKAFRQAHAKANNDPDLIMDAIVESLISVGLKKDVVDRMSDEQIMQVFEIVMPREKKS